MNMSQLINHIQNPPNVIFAEPRDYTEYWIIIPRTGSTMTVHTGPLDPHKENLRLGAWCYHYYGDRPLYGSWFRVQRGPKRAGRKGRRKLEYDKGLNLPDTVKAVALIAGIPPRRKPIQEKEIDW